MVAGNLLALQELACVQVPTLPPTGCVILGGLQPSPEPVMELTNPEPVTRS